MTNEARLKAERACVRGTFRALARLGLKPTHIFDGAEWVEWKAPGSGEDLLFDLDDASVRFDDGADLHVTLWFVFGNSPWEVVADSTIPKDEVAAELIERACTAVADRYEARYGY